jgi:cytochrome c oxidase assembly protein subunit 15
MTDLHSTPVALRRFAKFVAASTLFLIFAGAMVTSTGSGLAVPDWPLSYGMLMPKMIGGIFYEHGHRMIAATVGFLTVIQAIWLQLREPKSFVRRLGWTSLGAVVAQGVLGGLTVRFLLPPAISIAHAGLAEIFLCLNVSIAFFTSASYLRLRSQSLDTPTAATKTLVGLVYLQILAGALMRHLGAGLAIPDFPLSFGQVVPHITSAAIAANFAHRVGALLVTIAMIVVVAKAWRNASLRPLAIAMLAVVALQVLLGAEVVWAGARNVRYYHSLEGEVAIRNASITSFHVLTGATTLAVSLLLALAARTLAPRTRDARATAYVGSEVTA